MARFGSVKWGDVDADADIEVDKVGSGGADSAEHAQVQVFASAPDADGVKTITEFRTENGKKTKTIRKVKVIKKKIKVNRNVLYRRRLTKFGDCTGLPPGPEKNVTYHTHENIKLVLKCRKREDVEGEEDDDPLAKLKGTGDSIVVCRHCGETGHWTLKCPQRDAIAVQTKAMPNSGGAAPPAETGGKYVPVHLRNGGSSSGGAGDRNRRFEEDSANTIRVTNISEDTTEDDLRDLFRSFGTTTRIYLAKDRQTNVSRGFAFITYADRTSAQDAIGALNGYGYL